MRVGELIRIEAHEIAAAWAIEARQQVPADEAMSALVLLDHVPALLVELVAWLERGDESDARRYWSAAHKHALDRLNLEFELREVVHEYRVLRRVLFRRILAIMPAPGALDDVARMNEAIDCAIAEAVDQFSRGREKQRLEEAERSVGFRERFVGIVSHDLRNPLNAILMGASTLLQSDELPPGLGHVAGRIVANATRMGRMISDLLDLTRGRLGGGIPVSPARANLAAIALSVVDSVEAVHPQRKIHLRHDGNLDGEWDPDRLGQVIMNLVTNAIVHGDPAHPIDVEVCDAGNEVSIVVRNMGPPIPADEMPHMFDAFRRAREARGDGLGLGLFIASEIVRAHGGRIAVSSTQDEGTTFTLRLPRSARQT
jgi:signal transduction histidine kinase